MPRLALPLRVLGPIALSALVLLGTASCSIVRLGSLQSAHGRRHPLLGRILETSSGTFVTPAELLATLSARHIVLLGERHDNPEDHRLQAFVIRGLVAAGHRPLLVLEMLTPEQAAAARAYLSTQPGDVAGIGQAIAWAQTGWPPWSLYRPVFEAAVRADLPLVGAGLPAGLVKRIRRDGPASLEEPLRSRLGLVTPLETGIHAAMHREISRAHCDCVADSLVESMIPVQRARDMFMARALSRSNRSGAILIAGYGHVRRDWAVPARLAGIVPEHSLAALAFLEVDDDKLSPAEYAEDFETAALPFDYVWFTERASEEDPCRKFRAQLKGLCGEGTGR